jgi:ion channel POLLUX/CASTOR
VVIGVLRKSGAVEINPLMSTRYQSGDQVIAISEDDASLILGKFSNPAIEESLIRLSEPPPPRPERTLILGWNLRGETIVSELDNYVAEGSETIVICPEEEVKPALMSLAGQLKRQRLRFAKGSLTTRATLEKTNPTSFDYIILLSDLSLPAGEADANTLITLLHLRKIADAAGKKLSIVSEMQDIKNRALAQVARADDFIVSDKLVSLMLSQLSENKTLDAVFRVLFTNEGSEICLRPVSEYVRTSMPTHFFTLVEAAARKGHTALGYRRIALADDKNKGFGVVVNPNKSEAILFEPGDQLIVLADIG